MTGGEGGVNEAEDRGESSGAQETPCHSDVYVFKSGKERKGRGHASSNGGRGWLAAKRAAKYTMPGENVHPCGEIRSPVRDL